MSKGQSMFSMDNAHAVLSMELVDAKRYLLTIVQNSSANAANQSMAARNIMNTHTVEKLSSMVAGFILAHPSEGLKVIQAS